MNSENGNISIHTENIFPIIKKWLYSDKDIFIRELISNACDAVTKLKKLQAIGQAPKIENEQFKVTVVLDAKAKTLKFIDNGIGMTADEVKKYINQVAFSGAEDFLAKYKDKTDESNQIIGHFGLGFYSAFMAADKVQIDTLSYTEGAEAVKWICDGGTEYTLDSSERDSRGTTITLYISEDSKEFLSAYKVREVIEKYCSFLPVEIYFEEVKEETEDDKSKESSDAKPEEPKPINDIHPLWLKKPEDCTDEEYKEFYKKVFMDYKEPLFWVHLHVDYPFDLKGILYFPRLEDQFHTVEGQVKLYNNQVFVADNIKEVIPEFLLLLKGTIDCSGLPLNVSRSFLQSDSNVIKISQYITKKVADKLSELYVKDKDKYDSYWDDINPFIKFGCMKDSKFYDRVKDIVIFKTMEGKYVTLKEYLEANKDKHENKVFYVTDEVQQAQYMNIFKDNNLEALILTSPIDRHFITFLEMQESSVKFSRVDSDLSDTLKSTDDNDEASKEIAADAEKLFKDVLNEKDLTIKTEKLKSPEIPAMILLSEQTRRFQEMSQMWGGAPLPKSKEQTLVLNVNNDLVKTVVQMSKSEDSKEDTDMICHHIYDLAMLSQAPLEGEQMTEFIKRSNKILSIIAK